MRPSVTRKNRFNHKHTRIIQTQITPNIRVSTGAVFYNEQWGERFQYETWCFSDDPKQKSFQVIHGSCSRASQYLLEESIKIHHYISSNLKNRYDEQV